MTRTGLPQLIGTAFACVAPDLPTPPPPPWAWLCGSARLELALREAGFADVAVHEVTHHWSLPDPADFFRHLPDWLFASLAPETIDSAAKAFADVVRQHSTGDGLPHTALIGIGSRR